MHKHRMKFEKASPHFLFWRCEGCKQQYIELKETFYDRFPQKSLLHWKRSIEEWEARFDVHPLEFFQANSSPPRISSSRLRRALSMPELRD